MEKHETRTFVLPGEGMELARVLFNLELIREDNERHVGIRPVIFKGLGSSLGEDSGREDGDNCFKRLESRVFSPQDMEGIMAEVTLELCDTPTLEPAPKHKSRAAAPAPAAQDPTLATRVSVSFPVGQLCQEARIALLTGEFLKQSQETMEPLELDLSYLALMYAKAVEIEANARLFESVGRLPAPTPEPARLDAFMGLLNELAPLYGLERYADTARVRKAIQNSPANSSKGLGLRLAFDDHGGGVQSQNAALGCRLFLVQELRNGYIHHEVLTSDWKLDNLRRAAFDTLDRLIA